MTVHVRAVASSVILALSILAGGCASAPTPGSASSIVTGRQAVEAWTEELRPGPGFRIIVRNNSGQAVRITSVQLYDCENVDHACGPSNPNVLLAAGQSQELMRVGPALRDHAFTFKYRYSWSGAPTPS